MYVGMEDESYLIKTGIELGTEIEARELRCESLFEVEFETEIEARESLFEIEFGTEIEARESLFETFSSSWDVSWRLEVGSRSCLIGRQQGLEDEVLVNP